MFGKTIRFGKLFGITLTANWSLLLLVAVMSLYLAFSSGNILAGLIIGPVMMVLLFASVLAHELGHSLVAQRLGVRIQEIELHFFGGAAKMLSMPRTPRDEILIAAAGPAVSFALAGLFGLVSAVTATGFGVVSFLASINLILGAFNLIPALPTDGGRILRAALATRYSGLEATKIAVRVARVSAIGLGIYFVATLNFFGLLLVAFLWMLGTRELRMAEALHMMGRSPYESYAAGAGASATSPTVEVFDRFGRLVGTASGGVEGVRTTTSPFVDPRPELRAGFDGNPFSVRHTSVVRGSDGRLWVVRQSRSHWA